MDMVTKVAEALKSVFLASAEKVNLQAKAVKRRRKFTPASLAQTFILAFLKNPNATFENIACMAVASGIEVTAQAIEQGYSPELESFFKLLFQDLTKLVAASDQSVAPILERFTEVNLIDSSTVTLPDSQEEHYRGCGGTYGSGKAALKLQTELDLRSGSLRCVELEQGRSPDGASPRQHIEQSPNSLRIGDLGYFNIPVLRQIDQSEAYYLSRLQHHVKIFVDGVKHDLVSWLNSQQAGTIDCRVEIGLTERFGCRLIAYRVPEELANRRRRKLIAATRSKSKRPVAAGAAYSDSLVGGGRFASTRHAIQGLRFGDTGTMLTNVGRTARSSS